MSGKRLLPFFSLVFSLALSFLFFPPFRQDRLDTVTIFHTKITVMLIC